MKREGEEDKDRVATLPEHENEARLAAAERALAEERRLLSLCRHELAERERLLAAREEELFLLRNSLSWRLTAPLRSGLFRILAGKMSGEAAPLPSVEPYRVQILHPPEKERPRVVHALANFMTGGSSRLVVDLVERLGHRFEQEVITSLRPDPPHYAGVPVHEFPGLPETGELLDYFRRFRPAIVHVHYWGECDRPWYERVFAAAAEFGCRVIENVNTPVEPFFSPAVAHYVHVSRYLLETFGDRRENSSVIYPGSNFDIFARGATAPPDDCIGMVYRLEQDKLNERGIEPFITVVKRRPATKVLIVGGGSYLEPYREAARKAGVLPNFTFTGYVAYGDLPPLYERMSLFVAPVWKESFGQVSPFAMSMGLPIAGYDVGALSEILGSREWLAPSGDSDRLADLIIALLDDRQRRLAIGEANRRRALDLFSVEAMIAAYAPLYLRLAGGAS